MQEKKRFKITPFRIFLAIFLFLLICTNFFGNVFCLIANRGYYIPKDSDIFTFKATEMNEGSGEWWTYGRDWRNFYYNRGNSYLKIERWEVCSGFSRHDFTSWCGAEVVSCGQDASSAEGASPGKNASSGQNASPGKETDDH